MKKVLAILLVVAVMMTSSVAVMAIDIEKDLATNVELQVKAEAGGSYGADAEIRSGETVTLRATVDMSSVRNKVTRALELADEYCEGYYAGNAEQIQTEKDAVRAAIVEGTFDLVLTYPNWVELPDSMVEGTALEGFSAGAQNIVTEVGRTVTDSTLTISLAVKADLTLGTLESYLETYLADLTFTAAGLAFNRDGSYELSGQLTGYATTNYNGIIDEISGSKINFIKGEDAKVTVTVNSSSSSLPGIGRPGIGGIYNPSYEDDTVVDVAKWPFTDVNAGDWFYEGVAYSYNNGIFKGTTETTFEPNAVITRGMLVTALGRKDGVSDSAAFENVFADVASGEYYAAHIAWAVKNKIVTGYGDGNFGPNDIVTREQMATIMYRYMQYKGLAKNEDLSAALTYSDASAIADFAVDGVKYCYLNGIMTGKESNNFDPAGSATRAEIAVVMMRTFK